jgi:fructose-1,6-bisphosphatase II / sedoheptulose-1,7-bisphosphatase
MYASLALDMLRITEATALAAAAHTGRGEEVRAGQAAAQAMYAGLTAASVNGQIRVGIANQDTVEHLFNGEFLGTGEGPTVDIAVAPLEGPSICANGGPNALSILVLASPGGIWSCPDIYMDKIAAGPGTAEFLDLDRSARDNLEELARFKGCRVTDLTVVMLYRPRHEPLIREIREAGARIRLISDGDVAAALATTKTDSGIDILMGSGGATQGILAAAALRCVGGSMQARLKVLGQSEAELCRRAGIDDIHRKYRMDELVSGKVLFVATAITDGDYLNGIRRLPDNAQSSESVILTSEDSTVRVVMATHRQSS